MRGSGAISGGSPGTRRTERDSIGLSRSGARKAFHRSADDSVLRGDLPRHALDSHEDPLEGHELREGSPEADLPLEDEAVQVLSLLPESGPRVVRSLELEVRGLVRLRG